MDAKDEDFFPVIEDLNTPTKEANHKAPLGSLLNPNLVQIAKTKQGGEQGVSQIYPEGADGKPRIWERTLEPTDPSLDYLEHPEPPPMFEYNSPEELSEKEGDINLPEKELPVTEEDPDTFAPPIAVDLLVNSINQQNESMLEAKKDAKPWTFKLKSEYDRKKSEKARTLAELAQKPKETHRLEDESSSVDSPHTSGDFELKGEQNISHVRKVDGRMGAGPDTNMDILTPTQRQEVIFQDKLDESTRQVAIPNAHVFERKWPVDQAWEEREDGTRWSRSPEKVKQEEDWYRKQKGRLEHAKATGNFELIKENDQVTQEDILAIAKTAALNDITHRKLEEQRKQDDQLISIQRELELKSGIAGPFYDPKRTMDWANTLLDIKHKNELSDFISQQAERERQEEINSLRESLSGQQNKGFIQKIKQFFTKS